MNKKDQKLFEQLIAKMRYPTKESLNGYFMKVKQEYDTKDFDPQKTPGRIPLRENGTDILLSIHHADMIMDVGLVQSYQSGDMKHLHDALYTYSCVSFPISRYHGSGKDDNGEYVRCRDIIESFACCAPELTRKYCPPEMPVLTKGYRMWYVGYNLILGMLYQDEKRIGTGIQQAEKVLTYKNPRFDAAVIAYLMALAKNNAEEANRQFNAMMSVYRKSGLFEFHDEFLKVFALLPHGLFNMAHYFLSESDFAHIIPPPDTAFWVELSDYQAKNNFTHGDPFLDFDEGLNEFNVIYIDSK